MFSHLDLSLEPGNIYGLLGKNGAGKTTLLKLIAGLRYARSGCVRVLGFDPGARPAHMLDEIFSVPEKLFIPSLLPRTYVSLYAPFYPRFDHGEFAHYMKEFELEEDKKLSALSYGQKKRFVLAFVLACGCKVLLLDEPTNGLEMHQQGSGPFYLTLPGTTLEKLVSKLLVTSVGYAAAVLAFMTGASALSELLNRGVFAAGHTWFNPFSPAILKSAAVYLVCQSLFLLGSVWFRKVVFLKILLAENIVVVGLAIVTAVIFRVALGGLFTGGHPRPEVIQMFSQGFGNITVKGRAAEALNRGAQVFLTIARVLFWGAFAPVFWVAACFRLRETEV